MPIHIEENKKWEIFLKLITNLNTIKVSKVTNENIEFSLGSVEELHSINSFLKDPELVKANIIHAFNSNEQADSNKSASETITDEKLANLCNASGNEIFNQIFSEKFSKIMPVEIENFKDSPEQKIMTYKVEDSNELDLDLLALSLKKLQSSLNDSKKLANILLNNSSQIEKGADYKDITDFSQSILLINRSSSTEATIIFNYGNLLQAAQAYSPVKSAPIISLGNPNEQFNYSINRKYLLKYLRNIITSGVVFSREDKDDKLRAIIFEADKEENILEEQYKTVFYILLDTSGSMKDNFDIYKQKIVNILDRIGKSTSEWLINISEFNTITKRKNFDSDQYSINDIKSFIYSLSAEGLTNLYGTLYENLEELYNVYKDKNVNLILFTDGEDTEKKYQEEQIISRSKNIRESNSQFTMFTLGYGGHYKKEFFESMSNEGGFIHIDLKTSLNNINEFYQYIETMPNRKIMFEFVNAIMKSYEQCPENDIVIASQIVASDTKINSQNQEYQISSSTNSKTFAQKENDKKSDKLVSPPTKRGSYTEEALKKDSKEEIYLQ
ncbi:MAG: vWA domain-containing protein [Alphaproteobacteria bacterium]